MTAVSSGQIAQHKKLVEVTGLSNGKIKFLVNKFLYTRHLPGYRVLETAGNFEIVRLKPEEKRTEQHETLSPTMLPESIGLGGLPRWWKPSTCWLAILQRVLYSASMPVMWSSVLGKEFLSQLGRSPKR